MKRAIFLLILICSYTITKSQDVYKQLSASDFYIHIQQSEEKLILDCNLTKGYKKEHIEEAISVPKVNTLIQTLKEIDKETPIFVYCKHGDKSKTAAKKIRELGFKYIYELKDGLYEWKRQGYPTKHTKK